jgi:glycosyltransferase involved in cell wall biosynthesis
MPQISSWTRRVRDLRVAIAYDCLFPLNVGGGERVYRRIADLLVERGARVDYVTRRQWPAGAEPVADFAVVPVWSGEIYDTAGARTSSSALAFAAALFRHFRRHRRDYDLVLVAALPVLNVFAVWLALLGSKAEIVVDWLEVWPWRKWRSYAGFATGTIAFVLQYLAIRLGAIQTVNSSFTQERILGYRKRADPVVLGLMDLIGTVPEASAARVGFPLAAFVGRHIPDKRITALPAAVVEARRVVPDLHAVVVGSGPETAALRQRVHSLGLDDVFRVAGRVSDDELELLLRTASVLVNPSAREGFGLVIAEAAAHATPSVVVAGEDNAAADLVIDGVNGFIAADAEAVPLGEAIVRAIQGGEGLRTSTLAWFADEREVNGLGGSVDEVLARYRALSAR